MSLVVATMNSSDEEDEPHHGDLLERAQRDALAPDLLDDAEEHVAPVQRQQGSMLRMARLTLMKASSIR